MSGNINNAACNKSSKSRREEILITNSNPIITSWKPSRFGLILGGLVVLGGRIFPHFIHHAAFTDIPQNRVMLDCYNVKLFLCHPAGAS